MISAIRHEELYVLTTSDILNLLLVYEQMNKGAVMVISGGVCEHAAYHF
jgi:hypothetical protein